MAMSQKPVGSTNNRPKPVVPKGLAPPRVSFNFFFAVDFPTQKDEEPKKVNFTYFWLLETEGLREFSLGFLKGLAPSQRLGTPLTFWRWC